MNWHILSPPFCHAKPSLPLSAFTATRKPHFCTSASLASAAKQPPLDSPLSFSSEARRSGSLRLRELEDTSQEATKTRTLSSEAEETMGGKVEQTGQSDIITESDIPPPSEDFPLSPSLWPSFKAYYVGRKVPPPELSVQQLNALGVMSWKEYYIDRMASVQ